jgi:uncharacterized protein involved in exopolysaccharide biosynthesis
MFRQSNSPVSEPSHSHIHTEVTLYLSLSSLWRRKLLIVAIVATALGLGIIAVLVMPQRYTAEAYIRGAVTASDALAKNDEGSSAAIISLDLSRMIETQSLLLRSHQLARRVVEQLGPEKLRSEVGEGGWLEFYSKRADIPARQEDMAATRLLHGLSVTTDPRAYLITVRYTARDPELADLITNAFVAESLRSIRLQILSQQRSSTQASLSERLVKFGDKHPRVIEKRLGLQAIDSLSEKWQHATHDEILRAAGENVTQAMALPSSPIRFVISLHVLVGVLVGVGVALWLEQGNWWRALSQRYRTFEAKGPDAISVSEAAKVLVAARLAKRQNEKAC